VSKRRPLTRPVEDHEESEGRERWLISYADFITLLMAFFVVMYSISSVNTGKFRVLSNSLEAMWAPTPDRPVPVDLGGGAPPHDGLLDASRNIAAVDEPSGTDAVNAVTPDIVAPTAVPVVGTPREKLEAVMGEMGGRDDVKLRETKDWLEIELGSELLFPSGSAKLNVSANAASTTPPAFALACTTKSLPCTRSRASSPSW
jgi:chemotaxis protein MotB